MAGRTELPAAGAPSPHRGRATGQTFSEYQRARYFPMLDGLRAVSVLLVLVFHTHDRLWEPLNGYLGVTVFFVISGFLITTLLLREEDRDGKASVSRFYVRRAFRGWSARWRAPCPVR